MEPVDYARLETPLPEYLKGLIKSLDLTVRHRRLVVQLILAYDDIFAGGDHPPGRTDTVKHAIETSGTGPIRVPKQRIPLEQQKIIQTEVDRMINPGVVEPSDPSCGPRKEERRQSPLLCRIPAVKQNH